MHKLFSSVKALKVGALTLPLLLAACSGGTYFNQTTADAPRSGNEFSEFDYDYGGGQASQGGKASAPKHSGANGSKKAPSYYEQVDYQFPVPVVLNPKDPATVQRINNNASDIILFRQQTPAQFLELCHYSADLFESSLKGQNWVRKPMNLDTLVKRFNYAETHNKFLTLTRKVREGILVRGWNNMKVPPSGQFLVSQNPIVIQLHKNSLWSTLEPYQVRENLSSFVAPGTNNALFFSIQTPHGRRDFKSLVLFKAYRVYGTNGAYKTCVMNFKAYFDK